jgi:hypothetical protein
MSRFLAITTPRRRPDAIALFASMTEGEKDEHPSGRAKSWAGQGVVMTSLMIVRSGVVAVIRRDEIRETELWRLASASLKDPHARKCAESYPLEYRRTVEVLLGRAIFIEAAPTWSGSIDLDDQVSLAVLRENVGAAK